MKTINICVAVALMILLCSLTSASPLVKVEIFNKTYYESLTILDPNDGNWLELYGGKKVDIPTLKFVYCGINSTEYTKGDKTIRITTYKILKNRDYVINYPFRHYPLYYSGQAVKIKPIVERDIRGLSGYLYIVRTGPTKLKNALASAVDGNTKPIRNLLSNAVKVEVVYLGGNRIYSFTNLKPGDYIAVLTLNRSTDNNVTLVAATAFEILEHRSTISVRKTVRRSSVGSIAFVSGSFRIIGGSKNARYTYIAALIYKNAYSAVVRLESGGTKKTTNLKVNNALIVKSWSIGGVGLKHVNSTIVYNWLRDMFPKNCVSLEKETKKGNTFDFSLPIKDLPDGTYYLNIGAWNVSNPSQRLVAFSQAVIKITTVKPKPKPRPARPRVAAAGAAGGGGGIVVTAPPLEAKAAVLYHEAITVPAKGVVRIRLPAAKANAIGVLSVVAKIPERMMLDVYISKVKALPAGIPKPPADVYRYIEITLRKYGTNVKIELVGSIDFKVSRSWIASKGYDPKSIVLMEYHKHKGWKELKTKMTGKDSRFYYYRAKTGSFSIFAIAAKPVKVIPKRTPAAPPTPTATPVKTPTKTPTPVATPTPPPPVGMPTVIIGAVIAIVATATIAMYMIVRRRRKE